MTFDLSRVGRRWRARKRWWKDSSTCRRRAIVRRGSITSFTIYDRSKRLEALAVEFHQLKLIDGRIVGGTRFYLDARQIDIYFHIKTGHLLHNVVAREVVTAQFNYLDEGLRRAVAKHSGAILLVAIRIILRHECTILFDALIVLPLRIGWILQINCTDDLSRVIYAGGTHGRGCGCRGVAKKLNWLPPQLCNLFD